MQHKWMTKHKWKTKKQQSTHCIENWPASHTALSCLLNTTRKLAAMTNGTEVRTRLIAQFIILFVCVFLI